MMHILRAECSRIMRRGMILGAGVVVGLGILVSLIVFGQATTTPEPGEPQQVSASRLEADNGLVQAFGFASQVIGGASLVFFARTITNDYQHGTLKVLLTREPRRLAFLTGKVMVIAGFVTICVLAAVVAMAGTGIVVAAVRGFDVAQWGTPNGVAETLLGFLRLLSTAYVWGLFGAALATIFRSAGPAIGLGLGGFAIGGHIVERFFGDAAQWFPSLVLAAFTAGGTDEVSVVTAGLVAAAYAVGLALVAGFAFTRGDVPA